MRALSVAILLLALPLAAFAGSQPSPLPPVNGEPTTEATGYFNIIVDPDEYPKAGDKETEDIKLLSLVTAYGIIHGIEWYNSSTGDGIQINEKIYAIVHDMEVEEIVECGECYRYTYSYDYVVEKIDELKLGRAIEAVGESENTNMAQAWQEARTDAFIDAVRQALKRKYTDNQVAIPTDISGMITTYEILYDDYDFADEVYRFEITAWVGFEPRTIGVVF
jgi:hypothetical protein